MIDPLSVSDLEAAMLRLAADPEAIRHIAFQSSGSMPPADAPEDPTPETPVLSVKKIGAWVHIDNETLMDHGLIPDTREPVKVSRYRRARWRVREAVAVARLKVGEKIAGVTLDDRDDW